MKYLSLALLLLTTHLPLYLMDTNGEIILDEKSVKKILTCIEKCQLSQTHVRYEDIRSNMCTNVCTTVYKCKARKKLHKERTQMLLTQIKTQKPKGLVIEKD